VLEVVDRGKDNTIDASLEPGNWSVPACSAEEDKDLVWVADFSGIFCILTLDYRSWRIWPVVAATEFFFAQRKRHSIPQGMWIAMSCFILAIISSSLLQCRARQRRVHKTAGGQARSMTDWSWRGDASSRFFQWALLVRHHWHGPADDRGTGSWLGRLVAGVVGMTCTGQHFGISGAGG